MVAGLTEKKNKAKIAKKETENVSASWGWGLKDLEIWALSAKWFVRQIQHFGLGPGKNLVITHSKALFLKRGIHVE